MNKFILFASAFTLLLSSCSNNSNNLDVEIPEGNIKTLSLLVDIENSATKNGNQLSNFANEVTTNNLTQIGVHICNNNSFGNAYTDNSHNTIWSKSNNKWSPSTPILLGSDQANVYAYYPFNENTTLNVNAIPVVSGDTDYLFGKAINSNNETFVANNQNTVASIKMKHAMAQIVWNFTKEDSYTGQAMVTKISMNKLHKTGTLSIADGTISTSDEPSLHDLNVNLVLNPRESKNMMIIPTVYTAENLFAMTFIIDDKTMTSTFSNGVSFERGKKYNFNVKVNGTGIVIENVVVEDWATGGDSNLEIN